VESGVRAVPVVAMEPGLKVGGAMDGVGVDGGIGPFAPVFRAGSVSHSIQSFSALQPPI
jgi:hypothetical protein